MHSSRRQFNTKQFIIGLVLLLAIIGGTVAAAIAITSGDSDQQRSTVEVLASIRALMRDNNIQAYIILHDDAHQSEYIASRDERIAYVSGFTGSAGSVVITETSAAIWSDSRYHIQLEQQVDSELWQLMKTGTEGTPTLLNWITSQLANASRIGTDPFTIPSSTFLSYSTSLANAGHTLEALEDNLVDKVWLDRPTLANNPIDILNLTFSGSTISTKIDRLLNDMVNKNGEAVLVTALDDIAWLFNLRGADIEYNPVFFSYAIISHDKVSLFVNKERITDDILQHFDNEGVEVDVREYEDILNGIQETLDNITKNLIISDFVSYAIYNAIPAGRRTQAYSAVALMKSIKNNVEADGILAAHIRDGTALVRYLHWLDENVDIMTITELSGARQLEFFRSQEKNYRGLSFEAISASGANAAMAHYSPSEETDKQITRSEIYLIDSGGQYWDGTTDTTRTIHLGDPTVFQKESFTRVLKGFLSLVSATFPPNSSPTFFDAMARRALWDVGLDYGHGTGHGVGAYLNVHEYPPLLTSSASSSYNPTGILENMFTSNEPGYYHEGEFGIRLEDVIQVVPAKRDYDFDGRGALTFETVTFVPLQTKLMDLSIITKQEATIINNYHQRVRELIGPNLVEEPDVYQWLLKETSPIESMMD